MNKIKNKIINELASIGSKVIDSSAVFYQFMIFNLNTLKQTFTNINIKNTILQFLDVAFYSISLIALTGFFSGAVLALQSYNSLLKFGATSSVPAIVVLSLSRELGPVISALMIISRVASRITAELGTMSITSQINAMRFLNVNPIGFLISPRVVATTLGMPIASLIFTISGFFGAYITSILVLDESGARVINYGLSILTKSDVYLGLLKTVVFGYLFGMISCFNGYKTTGGTKQIGMATTNTVVISSVAILLSNYVLTGILY